MTTTVGSTALWYRSVVGNDDGDDRGRNGLKHLDVTNLDGEYSNGANLEFKI